MPAQNTPTLARPFSLTPEMIEQFEVFIGCVPPAEFRNQLVNLYLQFIISNPESYPGDFKQITDNLYVFLECLTNLQKAIDNKVG